MTSLSSGGDYVFVGKNVRSNGAIDQLREFSSEINYLRGYQEITAWTYLSPCSSSPINQIKRSPLILHENCAVFLDSPFKSEAATPTTAMTQKRLNC